MATYQYEFVRDLTAELSRPADFVIDSDSDWGQINNDSYQTIEVAQRDWSHLTISLSTSGPSNSNPKVIRPQVFSGAQPGALKHHPYHLPVSSRTVFPHVTGNVNCNNLIITSFEHPSRMSLDPWPRGNVYNNGIVIDRPYMSGQQEAGGGTIHFKYGARNCGVQFGYSKDCCRDGEGAFVAFGSEKPGEDYTNNWSCGNESLNHNQLMQWIQQQENATNPSDFSGFRAENNCIHYDTRFRTDRNGNYTASGAYSEYECGYSELKGSALDPNNPAIFRDGCIVGGRNCNDVGPNQSQFCGWKHPEGDGFSDLGHVKVSGWTAIDSNWCFVFNDGQHNGTEIEHITMHRCGVFATDNGNYLDDSPELLYLRNFAAANVRNVRNVDPVTSGTYLSFQGQNGNVTGTAAALGGYDKYVFTHPVSDPERYETIPGGSATYMPEPGGSSDPFDLPTDIRGGLQTSDVGVVITHVGERVVGGGGGGSSSLHWNPGPVFAVAKDGNDQEAYSVMLRGIREHKDLKDSHGNYIYKNFMVIPLWKWLEPGNRNYSAGSGWQFIDDCRDELNPGQSLGVYIKDRRFNASGISKTPVPSDLRSYPNSFFRSEGETLATANLARPNVVDRKIQLHEEFALRYNNDPKIAFVAMPESSITLPGGNLIGRDGEEISHRESYFNELKYTFTQSKQYLTNIPLFMSLNFLSTFDSRSQMDLFRELIDNMVAVGGGGITLSDALACRHPAEYVTRCCSGPGGYRIEAYNLMTEYAGQLIIAPQAQTWSTDHERFGEDYALMTDGAGQHSWHSHYPIYYPLGFTSRCYKYGKDSVTGLALWNGQPVDFESIIRQEIINNPYVNNNIPSSAGSGGGSTVGVSARHATVTAGGTNVSREPLSTAVAGTTETVTLWEGDTQHEGRLSYFDSNPDQPPVTGDGTPTAYPVSRVNLQTVPIEGDAGGDVGWDRSTQYQSSGHLVARGYNTGDKADYEIGQYVPVDLGAILPNDNPHHLYFHVLGFNNSSDSYWIKEEGVPMVNGSDQPIAVQNTTLWQPYADPELNLGQVHKTEKLVTRSTGTLKAYSREAGAVILAIVAVDARETALPTGTLGFVESSWGGGAVIAPPPDHTMRVGDEYEFRFGIELTADTPPHIPILESSDSTGLERTSFTLSDVGGRSIRGTFRALRAGTYTITGGIAAGGNRLVESITVIVEADSDIQWPDGINSTLPTQMTVEQGSTFDVNAGPVNLHGFELSPNRWQIEGAAIAQLDSSLGSATFRAETVGTATITYTMSLASDASTAQTWETVVTVTGSSGQAVDDVFIGGDREIIDGQTHSVRSTEKLSFAGGVGEWSADDAGVYFSSIVDKLTRVTPPGPGTYRIKRTVTNPADVGLAPIIKQFVLHVRERIETLLPGEKFCAEPRIVLEFETKGGSVYVRDYPSTPVPPGAVVLDALIDASGISTVSQRLNFRKGAGDIGTATLSIVDVNRDFSNWLEAVLHSGDSLKDKRVRIHRLCAGQEWTDDRLWRTYIFNKYSSQNGKYSISTLDVQRYLQKDVFNPMVGRLIKPITMSSTSFTVRVDGSSQKFPRLQHSDDYRVHPGRAVGYILIQRTKEVIAFAGSVTVGKDVQYQILQRGAFQTVPTDVTIEPGTSHDNKPAVEEFIYLAGPAPEVAYQVATGQSRDGSITLPDHWHCHVPPDLISVDSFDSIGPDIESVYLEFARLKKTSGKSWIETQCMVVMSCVMMVDSHGALNLTRSPSTLPDASADGVLTADDIVSISRYTSDFSTIKTGIIINWGWNWATEKFQNPTLIIDSDATKQHGYTEYEKLDLKGLQASTYTTAAVLRIADMMRGYLSHEGLSLSVNVMPDRDVFDAGDNVRLQLPGIVADPSGNEVDLNRAMAITRRSENVYSGKITYEVAGIGRTIQLADETQNPFNIPADKMRSGATDLSTVARIENGVIMDENPIPPGVYYYDGDLTHDAATGQLVLLEPGTIELRVIGAYNAFHPQSIVTDGMGKPAGTPGYFGSVTSGGGIKARAVWTSNASYTDDRETTDIAGKSVKGIVNSIPVLPLRLEAGVLSGYPTDLAGSGSPDGQPVILYLDVDFEVTPGADGVPGGGGIIIISRGGSTGTAGGFSLRGAPGNAGTLIDDGVYAGSSAGGAPGGLLWMIDGDHVLPELAGRVDASSGNLVLPASKRLRPNSGYTAGDDFHRPAIDPSPSQNYAGAAVSVQYVPRDSVPQEAPLHDDSELSPYLISIIDKIRAEAAAQLDDRAQTYVDDDRPSFGVEGDYWVNTAERDSAGYPTVYRHNGGEYVLVDPATSMIARMLILQHGNSHIADGKGSVFYPTSQEPAPPPTSKSDLWVQPDTGKWFRVLETPGGLIWGPKAVADAYYAPTSANVLPDPVFEQIVNDGRNTWIANEEYPDWVIGRDSEILFGEYGEGGTTGVLMRIPSGIASHTGNALLTSAQVFPAARDNAWRLSFRGSIEGPNTTARVSLHLLDANRQLIGYAYLPNIIEDASTAQGGEFYSFGASLSLNESHTRIALFIGNTIESVSFVQPSLFVALDESPGRADESRVRIDSARLELLPADRYKSSPSAAASLSTPLTTVASVYADFGVVGQPSQIGWQFSMRSTKPNRSVDIELVDGYGNTIIPGGEKLAYHYQVDYSGWRLWHGSITVDAGSEIGRGKQTVRLRMRASSSGAVEVKNARLYVR